MASLRERWEAWAPLAGMRCSCPPGCTVGNTWGDGPRACDPNCEPCRLMAGKPYCKPPNAKDGT